jgi:plastocyanin
MMTRHVRPLHIVVSVLVVACSSSSEPNNASDGAISIVKLAGDNQIDTVFATLADPLRVQIQRAGRAYAGATVTWRPDDQPSVSTLSDATGGASFIWTLPSTDEPNLSLLVSTPGIETPVVFGVRVEGGHPIGIGKEFEGVADVQIGVVGKPILWKYGVWAFDAHGNDNASGALAVDWKVSTGGGSLSEFCGPECWCPEPVAKCVFYVSARHTLGPEEGLNTVTATAPSLPGAPSLTFTAVGVTALVEVRAFVSQAKKNAAFFPDTVMIPVGRTVGWFWAGDYDAEHAYLFEKHDVVFEDDPSLATSSQQRVYGFHTRKFTQPGEYRYRCTLHSSDFATGEVGIVVVN